MKTDAYVRAKLRKMATNCSTKWIYLVSGTGTELVQCNPLKWNEDGITPPTSWRYYGWYNWLHAAACILCGRLQLFQLLYRLLQLRDTVVQIQTDSTVQILARLSCDVPSQVRFKLDTLTDKRLYTKWKIAKFHIELLNANKSAI